MDIKPIETSYNGYRFRSRLEARWAVFFHGLGLEYQYEPEGYQMDAIQYLPDFYVPSLNRWFEIKGKPLSVNEIQKCEEFCRRLDNENIKFSILLGPPQPAVFQDEGYEFFGVLEYTWQWPSKMYPENIRIHTGALVNEDYYSRFIQCIWCVKDVDNDKVLSAVRKSREARFEFGEKPD